MELRDVSYADAPSTLIARQTITDTGHVPIKFKVEYNRDDIDLRNTYSISADIIESDGRLAFTNDTAYEEPEPQGWPWVRQAAIPENSQQRKPGPGPSPRQRATDRSRRTTLL